MEDTEKSKEPVFFTNDEHFLTTLVPNGVAVGSRVCLNDSSLEKWISDYFSATYCCQLTVLVMSYLSLIWKNSQI